MDIHEFLLANGYEAQVFPNRGVRYQCKDGTIIRHLITGEWQLWATEVYS